MFARPCRRSDRPRSSHITRDAAEGTEAACFSVERIAVFVDRGEQLDPCECFAHAVRLCGRKLIAIWLYRNS
jgi:hypothetical protein